MSCTGRYAEAIDFATTFCVEQLVTGQDEGEWPDNPFLTDNGQDFIALRMQVGSPVYNATTGVHGLVTAVAEHVLQTSTVTFSDGDLYEILPISANMRATIERSLNVAAGPIHMARQAANACDCSLTEASRQYLRYLNCAIAAVFHNCSCGGGRLSESERASMMMYINEQLMLIRTQQIELCAGASGADFPAAAYVQRGWTPEISAEIELNRRLREG